MTQLHQANVRVEFNPFNIKQVDEAKRKYIQARDEGRSIADLEGQPLERFQSSLGGFLIQEVQLDPDQFAMRIFDDTGDRRLIWNATDPHQIKEAKALFDKYIAKGWKPYAIARDGSLGRKIKAFDADAEEIIFDDDGNASTTRQKLQGFGRKFKEVKLLPRTFPG